MLPGLLTSVPGLLLVPCLLTFGISEGQRQEAPDVYSVGCDRSPKSHDSPKTPGDNGFRIVVHSYPKSYTPGRTYTVSLLGQNNGNYVQKFRGFMLVSVPGGIDAPGRPAAATPTLGRLQVIPRYASSQYSTDPLCSAAIVETTSQEKTRVDVKWTAPPSGSGCVNIRATVVERQHIWYQDDGSLSTEMCEEPKRTEDPRRQRPRPAVRRPDSGRRGPADQRTRVTHRHHGNHGATTRHHVGVVSGTTAGGHKPDSSPEWIDPLDMLLGGQSFDRSREIERQERDKERQREREEREQERRKREERRKEEIRRQERIREERQQNRPQLPANQLLEQKRICMQPSVVGPCRALLPRFFFNPSNGECVLFNYGGCQGNDNNFATQEECQTSCRLLIAMINPQAKDRRVTSVEEVPETLRPQDLAELKQICMEPLDVGPCRASIPRFGFSPEKGMCVPFLYGGCRGNDNNFEDENKCTDTCGPVAAMLRAVPEPPSRDVDLNDRKRICLQPQVAGPCEAYFRSYSFDKEKLMCVPFVYGGCQGNDNRFETEQECANTCKPVRQMLIDAASITEPRRRTNSLEESKRVCMMPSDPGHCRALIPRFTFNTEKGMCVPFNYGGCAGNDNNFEDERTCLDACQPLIDMLRSQSSSLPNSRSSSATSLVEAKRICMMSQETGPCRGSLVRYAFNTEKTMCVPFTYGGCRGNENNFESEQFCLNVCQPLQDMLRGNPLPDRTRSRTPDNAELVESKRICMMPEKTGRCRANIPRFAFNVEKGMCVPFTYGGCAGNENRFRTESECQQACGPLQMMLRKEPETGRKSKRPRKNKDKYFGASGAQPNVNRFSPDAKCCACGQAKYKLVFKGIWSPNSHPKDFPTQLFLTHWSDIIGGSHSKNFRIYEYGGFASEGLKWVAEYGSVFNLEKELKQHSSEIRTVVKTRGLWYPRVQESTSAFFSVNQSHHLLSIVSMLGPSPDWFVGLDSLNLCNANCTWKRGMKFEMRPIDAGTDSGITYMAANAATVPRERIRPITSTDPNNPRQAFYDPTGKPIPPLAKVFIKREKLVGEQCGQGDGKDEAEDDDDDFWEFDEGDSGVQRQLASSEKLDASHPKCAVGQWSEWSPCSSTCGNGLRGRIRKLSMAGVPESMCDVQLMDNEMCLGPHGECDPNDPCALSMWSSWSPCSVTCGSGSQMRVRTYEHKERAMVARCSQIMVEKRECDEVCNELYAKTCMTTDWSEWSDCSVTCGQGFRMRGRGFSNTGMDTSICKESLIEKQECLAVDCIGEVEASGLAAGNEACATTPFGAWTPCSAPCGKGVMSRQRAFVNKRKAIMMNCRMDVLEVVKDCMGFDCETGTQDFAVLMEAKRVCMQPAEMGTCTTKTQRFGYIAEKGMCTAFIFSGCGGNENNFGSEEECLATCRPLRDMFLAGSQAPFGEVEEDYEDYEDEGFVFGPRLPLITSLDSYGGKKLKTYKVKNKFLFEDNRNEGVPIEPIVQAEDPNVPVSPNRTHEDEKEQSEIKRKKEEREKNQVWNNQPSALSVKTNAPVDCKVSEWGEWTPCSVSCGKKGKRFRKKTILIQSSNGGKKCPKKKLKEKEKCQNIPKKCPIDCVMSDWGEWSECGKSCGEGSAQTRKRKRVTRPRRRGKECGPSKEKRNCNLPICPT